MSELLEEYLGGMYLLHNCESESRLLVQEVDGLAVSFTASTKIPSIRQITGFAICRAQIETRPLLLTPTLLAAGKLSAHPLSKIKQTECHTIDHGSQNTIFTVLTLPLYRQPSITTVFSNRAQMYAVFWIVHRIFTKTQTFKLHRTSIS